MRQKRIAQLSIFDQFAEHELGKELSIMSAWLDEFPEFADLVAGDLISVEARSTGRQGFSAETVLRCAILKQVRQVSYEELAFYLADSLSFRAFSRLPNEVAPRKSALQALIGNIQASTWEAIQQQLLQCAQRRQIETGRKIRIDSTVTETHIKAPLDSQLLWDAVRVMVRLLKSAEALDDTVRHRWRNHSRVAKKLARKIDYTRGAAKKQVLYRDLIKVVDKTVGYLNLARAVLTLSGTGQSPEVDRWCAEVAHYQPLMARVTDQTRRRVFQGEQVPVADKIVSLFEEHTDIIRKGGRETQFGHKLNLSGGSSGLILDVMVERGNPADTARVCPLLARHIELYGKPPRQLAADGGYASQENVSRAREMGVRDVAFHKKRGLEVDVMAKSPWVYRQLRNFRAGIEAKISHLKRSFGLSRCRWRGWEGFQAYVWSSVVTYNLMQLSRLQSP